MQSESLFDAETDGVFLQSLLKNHRPTTLKKHLANNYKMLSSTKNPDLQDFHFELHDHYIFCSKNSDSPEIAFMDIENSFLKIIRKNQNGGLQLFGLRFTKKRVYEELFSEN